MNEIQSPFLLNHEVQAISRLGELARHRLEKRGLFPRRIKIGGKRVAWRRVDIELWAADPEAWRKSNPPTTTAAGGGA